MERAPPNSIGFHLKSPTTKNSSSRLSKLRAIGGSETARDPKRKHALLESRHRNQRQRSCPLEIAALSASYEADFSHAEKRRDQRFSDRPKPQSVGLQRAVGTMEMSTLSSDRLEARPIVSRLAGSWSGFFRAIQVRRRSRQQKNAGAAKLGGSWFSSHLETLTRVTATPKGSLARSIERQSALRCLQLRPAPTQVTRTLR